MSLSRIPAVSPGQIRILFPTFGGDILCRLTDDRERSSGTGPFMRAFFQFIRRIDLFGKIFDIFNRVISGMSHPFRSSVYHHSIAVNRTGEIGTDRFYRDQIYGPLQCNPKFVLDTHRLKETLWRFKPDQNIDIALLPFVSSRE